MIIQDLAKTVSAVANSMGVATFLFEQIPMTQIWTGSLNCATAPDTADFVATCGADVQGTWIGGNIWGPCQVQGPNQLTVTATGLVPGTTYQLNWSGSAVTEGEPDVVWPDAYADAVTTSTDNIFLGKGTQPGTNIPGGVVIAGNARWRSIWVVIQSGLGSTDSTVFCTLQGQQSGTEYEAFLPPYFVTANDGFYMFRFAVLPGVDSTYLLSAGVGTAFGFSYWYGADLANIDTAIYPDGTSALPIGALVGNSPTPPGPGYTSTLDVVDEGGLQSVYATGLVANQILALLPPMMNPYLTSGWRYRIHSYYRRATATPVALKGVVFGQTPTNGVWANGATVAFATAANVVVACYPPSIVTPATGTGSEWSQVNSGTIPNPYVVVGGTSAAGVEVVNLGVLPVTTTAIAIAGLTATTKMIWDGVRYVFGLGTISGSPAIFVLDLLTLTLLGTLAVAGATDITLAPNASASQNMVAEGAYLFVATSTSNQILRTTRSLGSTTTMTGGSAGTGYNHIVTDGNLVYALGTGTTWSIDVWHAQSPWAFSANYAGVASAAAATQLYFSGQIITGSVGGNIFVGYQASGTSFPTVRCIQAGGATVSTTTIVSTIGTVTSIVAATPGSTTVYVTTSGVASIYPLSWPFGTVGTAIAASTNSGIGTSTGTGWVCYTYTSVTAQILTASSNTVASVTVTDTVGATAYDPFTGTFVAVQAAVGINTIVSTGLGLENDAMIDTSTTVPGPNTSLKGGRLVSAVYVQVTGATTNVEVGYDVVLQPVIA